MPSADIDKTASDEWKQEQATESQGLWSIHLQVFTDDWCTDYDNVMRAIGVVTQEHFAQIAAVTL